MEEILNWVEKHSPKIVLGLFVLFILHVVTSCALYEGARLTAEDKVRQVDIESCKKISSKPEECENAYNRRTN